MVPVFLLIAALLLPTLPLASAQALATTPGEVPHCHLALAFSGQGAHTLEASATIAIPPGQRLTLTLPGLCIDQATLADHLGRESDLPDLGNVLILPPAEAPRRLKLVYHKEFADDPDNRLAADGITLTRDWHPLPEKPMLFSLTAELPPGFSAITEADRFPLAQEGNRVHASFSRPTTTIHFAAGPYQLGQRQVRDGLTVHSLFFPEDGELAEGYLEAAALYLRRYEQELGTYPHNHYAIVANRLPSGLGIPSFSLFGQRVLRLPFIKETSLGHEIVHSWFGNGVEVDAHGGNWCEGLTAFLSDHRYREERGEGIADRHESIIRYLSYVGDDLAIPLQAFVSADHHQQLAEARRAVGYQRGALLFHELREKIGPVAFRQALRHLVRDFHFQPASWKDLEKRFSDAAAQNLGAFFQERLSRADIPDLAIADVAVAALASDWQLSLTIEQKSAQPYTLKVPIAVESPSGTVTLTTEISEKTHPLTITLDRRPTAVTIDPGHDFLRQLSEAEMAPTWSRFLGGRKRLAIVASEQERQRYQPLLEMLGEPLMVTLAAEVSDRQLAEHHLLFLGRDQAPARALFGPPREESPGLSLEVRANPLAREFVAVLLDLAPGDDNRNLLGRLGHYGKYARLAFANGVNIDKQLPAVEHGIRVQLDQLPAGGATSDVTSFAATARQLAKAKIVYLGESHTSYGDHLLQLRVIEALHRHDPRLVIGMEMFPTTVQEALDDYLLTGKIATEKAFLKASRYFQVWRYDYRLYRDIIAFAKARGIRILGLNLENHIVNQVFRQGGSDGLEPAARAMLPLDRDLDLPGYGQRLRQTHGMHQAANLATGSAAGFLQAQALWDETMAEQIAAFAARHPEQRLVVLAGRQHTRKDNGIPPRVARRLDISQASVVTIGDGPMLEALDKIADFYFLSPVAALPEAAKIGVTLEMAEEDGAKHARVTGLSPHGRAKEAGLAVGDLLLAVNGQAIDDIGEVQLALLDARPGDSAEVRISRPGPAGKSQHSVAVVLSGPPAMPTHP